MRWKAATIVLSIALSGCASEPERSLEASCEVLEEYQPQFADSGLETVEQDDAGSDEAAALVVSMFSDLSAVAPVSYQESVEAVAFRFERAVEENGLEGLFDVGGDEGFQPRLDRIEQLFSDCGVNPFDPPSEGGISDAADNPSDENAGEVTFTGYASLQWAEVSKAVTLEDSSLASLTVTLVCDGPVPHNLVVEGYNDDDLPVAECQGDDEDTIVISPEPGAYTYYCSIPGHREAGMEGTISVTSP